MAEWSCSGLQIRPPRFDSELRLQFFMLQAVFSAMAATPLRCSGTQTQPAYRQAFCISGLAVFIALPCSWLGRPDRPAASTFDNIVP
jgi:hypothetical protein